MSNQQVIWKESSTNCLSSNSSSSQRIITNLNSTDQLNNNMSSAVNNSSMKRSEEIMSSSSSSSSSTSLDDLLGISYQSKSGIKLCEIDSLEDVLQSQNENGSLPLSQQTKKSSEMNDRSQQYIDWQQYILKGKINMNTTNHNESHNAPSATATFNKLPFELQLEEGSHGHDPDPPSSLFNSEDQKSKVTSQINIALKKTESEVSTGNGLDSFNEPEYDYVTTDTEDYGENLGRNHTQNFNSTNNFRKSERNVNESIYGGCYNDPDVVEIDHETNEMEGRGSAPISLPTSYSDTKHTNENVNSEQNILTSVVKALQSESQFTDETNRNLEYTPTENIPPTTGTGGFWSAFSFMSSSNGVSSAPCLESKTIIADNDNSNSEGNQNAFTFEPDTPDPNPKKSLNMITAPASSKFDLVENLSLKNGGIESEADEPDSKINFSIIEPITPEALTEDDNDYNSDERFKRLQQSSSSSSSSKSSVSKPFSHNNEEDDPSSADNFESADFDDVDTHSDSNNSVSNSEMISRGCYGHVRKEEDASDYEMEIEPNSVGYELNAQAQQRASGLQRCALTTLTDRLSSHDKFEDAEEEEEETLPVSGEHRSEDIFSDAEDNDFESDLAMVTASQSNRALKPSSPRLSPFEIQVEQTRAISIPVPSSHNGHIEYSGNTFCTSQDNPEVMNFTFEFEPDTDKLKEISEQSDTNESVRGTVGDINGNLEEFELQEDELDKKSLATTAFQKVFQMHIGTAGDPTDTDSGDESSGPEPEQNKVSNNTPSKDAVTPVNKQGRVDSDSGSKSPSIGNILNKSNENFINAPKTSSVALIEQNQQGQLQQGGEGSFCTKIQANSSILVDDEMFELPEDTRWSKMEEYVDTLFVKIQTQCAEQFGQEDENDKIINFIQSQSTQPKSTTSGRGDTNFKGKNKDEGSVILRFPLHKDDAKSAMVIIKNGYLLNPQLHYVNTPSEIVYNLPKESCGDGNKHLVGTLKIRCCLALPVTFKMSSVYQLELFPEMGIISPQQSVIIEIYSKLGPEKSYVDRLKIEGILVYAAPFIFNRGRSEENIKVEDIQEFWNKFCGPRFRFAQTRFISIVALREDIAAVKPRGFLKSVWNTLQFMNIFKYTPKSKAFAVYQKDPSRRQETKLSPLGEMIMRRRQSLALDVEDHAEQLNDHRTALTLSTLLLTTSCALYYFYVYKLELQRLALSKAHPSTWWQNVVLWMTKFWCQESR